METDRLKYFCAIAELGSLTKASEILNVSHSGLSKAMAVLQQELNTQLFRPLGRGLELTAEGTTVYHQSKKLLEEIEQLKTHGLKSSEKSLRVGMTEVLTLSLAKEFLKNLDRPVEFYELDSGEIEVKILAGEIDFAVSFIPYPHPEIEYLKLKKTRMGVFFVNPKFQVLSLAEIPFVGPKAALKDNPLSIKSRDGWPAQWPRTQKFGANTLSMALQMVDAGFAALFMPCFLAEVSNEVRPAHLKLREYEVPGKSLSRDIYLVKKKNQEESKEMKIVAKVVRQKC